MKSCNIKVENDNLTNIEKYIEKINTKSIVIKQTGFVSSKFLIKKLVYNIKSDILNLKDENSDFYLIINLNQAYKIKYSNNKIQLYLDNDIKIELF